MNRPLFALIAIAIVAIILLLMWLGWRARARRDAGVRGSAVAPSGPLFAEFSRVLYVSTTPVGEPLVRVAAPGLRYRGQAEIRVHEDGVTVAVVGEDPTHFDAAQLRGSAAAGRRVGKAVEHEGLGLMRWVPARPTAQSEQQADPRLLESSFRFESKAEQLRFAEAIQHISISEAEQSAAQPSTSQEDAK